MYVTLVGYATCAHEGLLQVGQAEPARGHLYCKERFTLQIGGAEGRREIQRCGKCSSSEYFLVGDVHKFGKARCS